MLVIIIICLLILFFLIILFRTLAFKPIPISAGKTEPITADGDAAALNLSRLIQKRTVFSRFTEDINIDEFQAFMDLLPQLYPKTHKTLERRIINKYAMLYRWKGLSGEKPLVLMAHYDVVAASLEGWEHPPFSGDIKNGIVWGRGTLDTKGTLVSALEAVESLIKSSFSPMHDIYLSFSYDEEIDGVGTEALVSWFRENGVTPGLVVDEGGAVVEDIFPKPTLEMIDTLGRHTPFGLRMIFANMWLFRPLLVQLFIRLSKETRAMCRTTVAITMLKGSKGANVLPSRVSAAANIRVAVGCTVEETLNHLKKAINDPDVEIDMIYPGEPSPVSDTDETYRFLGEIIHETWPNTVVSPYVMLGASDSRHYSKISNHVYRFSPFTLSKKERDSMHAVNECIPVSTLKKAVEFHIRLIGKY